MRGKLSPTEFGGPCAELGDPRAELKLSCPRRSKACAPGPEARAPGQTHAREGRRPARRGRTVAHAKVGDPRAELEPSHATGSRAKTDPRALKSAVRARRGASARPRPSVGSGADLHEEASGDRPRRAPRGMRIAARWNNRNDGVLMKQDLAILLQCPEPPMPDVVPDPVPPGHDGDDLPPDLPEPYRHPEGDPPEHRPPEHEPPGHEPPPVRALQPGAGLMPRSAGRRCAYARHPASAATPPRRWAGRFAPAGRN
jgi:hypothetical protein